MRWIVGFLAVPLLFGPASAQGGAEPVWRHAIAMHGAPKYPAGFARFGYVNPQAPNGGSLWLAAQGTFDSLNPFIAKGTAAAAVGMIYDTLMKRSGDEAFSMYPLLAERIRTPADRSWVEFALDARARWHDGRPVTVSDVIFSLKILREQPFYRYYFRDIAKVEQTGPRRVKFTFAGGTNRELPLIVAGDLPILPQHYWQGRDFAQFSLDPPLGSGPYRIAKVSPGRRIELARVADYWARDLPANVGYNNFDRIRYEYFFDAAVMREALKAGRFDYRAENTASAWARAYDIAAKREGLLIQKTFPIAQPSGMQAFVYNLRNPLFQDRRVRQALVYAFDFEWTNANIFFGQYTRTRSFFDGSELAAREGRPQGRVLALLRDLKQRHPGAVPQEVFAGPRPLPVYRDSNIRPGLRAAFALLREAGWVVRDFRLVNAKTGRPFRFTILLRSPAFERVVLPVRRNLKRLGIDMRIRLVDYSQYVNRVRRFDFDMTVLGWGQSLSPGNEQRGFWTTPAAGRPGSRNWSGLRNPAVDDLVERLIAAPDRQSLILRTRALDRLLLSHHFVIPNWHISYERLVFWDKFGYPDRPVLGGSDIMTWWVDPARAARLRGRIASLK